MWVIALAALHLCSLVASQPVNIPPSACVHGQAEWFPAFDKVLSSTDLFKDNTAVSLFHSNKTEFRRLMTAFSFQLYTDFLPQAFSAPITNPQRPYPLTVDCRKSKYSTILSGERRVTPAKIAWASHMDSEVYLLKMRLYTYDDLVDYHLIAESTRTQRLGTFKPLVYDRVKHHLQPFLHKVVHFILDHTRTINADPQQVASEDWKGEVHERGVFYRYLHKLDFLADEDLIVYGDFDELADEDYLYHLKHCELQAGVRMPLNSNAPFYKVDSRFMFRNDHPPSPEFPYSLKFPQIWRYGVVRQTPGLKLRTYAAQGLPFPSVPGGGHWTYYGFLPSLYLGKGMNIAEAEIGKFFANPKMQNAASALATFQQFEYTPSWRYRVTHPDCIRKSFPIYNDTLLHVPWLAAQNPAAFPELMVCDPAFYDTVPGFKTCSRR